MKRSSRYLSTYLGTCLTLLGLCSTAVAQQHTHKSAAPSALAAENVSKASDTKSTNIAPCEITILNYTYEPVDVYGRFDDGSSLDHFRVYPQDEPHYISLYYYGYCHSGMNLSIYNGQGRLLYSRFTYANETLKVQYSKSQLQNNDQSKAQVQIEHS